MGQIFKIISKNRKKRGKERGREKEQAWGEAEDGDLGVRGPAGRLGIYRMMVVLYHLINKKMEKMKDVVLIGLPPIPRVHG